MGKITEMVRKKVLGYKADSDSYIEFLRNKGVLVGEDVRIFRPNQTVIDVQNPHLLSIGDHVMMTGPVTILTHDYSWSVLKRKYGYVYGKQRRTVIGNNVFIGWGATILPGARIGDNVVIGANSVVGGRVDSDSVYAGNPAKKLLTLDEFFARRQDRQFAEAADYVLAYEERFGTEPPESELDEYFFLFADADRLNPAFEVKMKLVGNYEESMEMLRQNVRKFNSYEEFLKACHDRRAQ